MSITPGQAPDLSVYYNSKWFSTEYFSQGPEDKVYNSVGKVPVTSNSTQPPENSVGFIAAARYITDGDLSVENQSFLVQNWTLFLPEGTISFSPSSSYLENAVFGTFAFDDNQTYFLRIVSGTKNFFASNGYVAIVTDDKGGRNVYVYFSK
jgi:hypothetical protein